MQPIDQIQRIRQSVQKMRFFRWLMLLWIVLVYVWGLQWGSVRTRRR